jgi:WD40 repeat protein
MEEIMRRIVLSAMLLLCVASPVWAQQAGDASCDGLNPVALIVGEAGRVSAGNANNVRATPGTTGERLGAIPGGAQFSVLDGPQCADGFVWWQVDYQGLIGWTVDGADGEQWLFPVDADEAAQPTSEPPFPLFSAVITPENVYDLAVAFEPACETGAEFTSALRLSNNQRYLAFYCAAQSATAVYDLAERRQIASLVTEEDVAGFDYAFLPGDQQLLVTYGVNSRQTNPETFTVWDIASGEIVASLPYDDWYLSVYDAARGELVLLEPEQIRRLDARTLEETSRVPLAEPFDPDTAALALSADGTTLAAISSADAGIISLWDTASGTLLPPIDTPFMTNILPTSLVFSPSGRFILAAGCKTRTGEGFFCGDPEILWGEVATGTIIERWAVPISSEGNNSISITRLAFSPDGKLLAAGASSNLLVYAVQSGTLVFNTLNRAHQVEFSRDGTFLVTTGDGVFTRVWHIP